LTSSVVVVDISLVANLFHVELEIAVFTALEKAVYIEPDGLAVPQNLTHGLILTFSLFGLGPRWSPAAGQPRLPWNAQRSLRRRAGRTPPRRPPPRTHSLPASPTGHGKPVR